MQEWEGADKLLRIADPDNFFSPTSRAAQMAREKGKKALEAEKKKKEAEEQQRLRRVVGTLKPFSKPSMLWILAALQAGGCPY